MSLEWYDWVIMGGSAVLFASMVWWAVRRWLEWL